MVGDLDKLIDQYVAMFKLQGMRFDPNNQSPKWESLLPMQ